MKLTRNQNVAVEPHNKTKSKLITAKQSTSTPGVFLSSSIDKGEYIITVEGQLLTNCTVKLWIATDDNKVISFNQRITKKPTSLSFMYSSKSKKIIKYGLFFSQSNIGDQFIISKATCTPINKTPKTINSTTRALIIIISKTKSLITQNLIHTLSNQCITSKIKQTILTHTLEPNKSFHESMDSLYNKMKSEKFDYIFFLYNDSIVRPNFIQSSIEHYDRILKEDPHMISLSLSNDRQKGWNRIGHRKYSDETILSQWVDIPFVCKKRYMEILNYGLKDFSKEYIKNGDNGVHHFISNKIFKKRYNMYLTTNSLVLANLSNSNRESVGFYTNKTNCTSTDNKKKIATVCSSNNNEEKLSECIKSIVDNVDVLFVILIGYSFVPRFDNPKIIISDIKDYQHHPVLSGVFDKNIIKYLFSDTIFNSYHFVCDEMIYPKEFFSEDFDLKFSNNSIAYNTDKFNISINDFKGKTMIEGARASFKIPNEVLFIDDPKAEYIDLSNIIPSDLTPIDNSKPINKSINKSKISVIMPVFNMGVNVSMTINAINSVINQTYTNWELIIIDDHSTDNTFNVINEYIEALNKKRFKDTSKIQIIKSPQNTGCYVAMNKCLNLISGEYFARLDSDDYYHKEKLEKQINIMESDNNIVMVYCDVQEISTSRVKEGCGTAALYRTSIIDTIGYFDSITIGADTEYTTRIAHVFGNKRIGYVKDIMYYINKREGSLTTSKGTGMKKNTEGSTKRRNLVKSFRVWHKSGKKLYMPFPLKLKDRPYEVHESIISKHKP